MKTKEALNFLHEKNEKELLQTLSKLNGDLINKSNIYQNNKEKLKETEISLNEKMDIKEYKLKHAYYMYLIEQQELLNIEILEIKKSIDKNKEEIIKAKKKNEKINDYFKEKEKETKRVIERRENWLNNYKVKNPYEE